MDAVHPLFDRIDRLAKILARARGDRVRELGLTTAQHQVLTWLADAGGTPPKDLAAGLGCTRATITGVADGLERRGLVRRTPHPSDRRSLLLHVTAEGRALLERLPRSGEDAFSTDDLSENDLEHLDGLLARVEAALGQAPGSPRPPREAHRPPDTAEEDGPRERRRGRVIRIRRGNRRD